ncbi:hypothetical protein BDW67DRAFT_43202 [Aspergillus spinulosporus]
MASDMGELPMIKCSDCGVNVDILAMGDHVCAKPANVIPRTPSPPSPPPKSMRRPTLGAQDAWSSNPGRAEPPLSIDPLRANHSFLNPSTGQDGSLFPSPLSSASGSRSPLRTAPVSHDSSAEDSSEGIPSFPLPRSMSGRRVNGMAVKEEPGYTHAVNRSLDHPPHSAHLPLNRQDQPPPPLPKDDASFMHKHSVSVDSKSSYRTSLASTRYGDRSSKRSTAISSRRPSFGSVALAGYRYEEDIPPIPQSPPRPLYHSVFSDSSMSDISAKRDGKNEVHSGFDFSGALDKPAASPLRVSSAANSERLSSSRGSAELFFSSPAQSTYGPPLDLPESEFRSELPAESAKVEYKAFRPSASDYLQPNPSDQNGQGDTRRKNSDATDDSAISVSNFARALGLDINDEGVEDSTTSSDSSPSETRSGTSLSSIQSDVSTSRRKPSDLSRLGPVVEDPRNETGAKAEHLDKSRSESHTVLEPPRIPENIFSPDSPTDPALSKGGDLSLVSEISQSTEISQRPRSPQSPLSPQSAQNVENGEEQNPSARAATEPTPRPHQPKPRGPCRGCGEMIIGKSISSADGRLTGRYHRACFVCFQCRLPFETNDFYVLKDRPYCAQHYHERNGSICAGCHEGIEGEYLETNERTGPGPGDTQKFHLDCLRCRTCNIDLQGEYYEWNGYVYCERDARRAAASVSPHGFRRPTMPSSPLGPPGPGMPMPPPSRGRPPPPGYPGPGRGRGRGPRPPGPPGPYGPGPGRSGRPGPGPAPYGRPPPSPNNLGLPGQAPGGARRFPERRTTKLMNMI